MSGAIVAALPHATNENIMVSGTAVVRCRKILTRDVVLYTRADGRALGAGEVLWHAAVADDRWTCVAVWEVLDGADDSSRYIKCRVREDDTRLLPTSLLRLNGHPCQPRWPFYSAATALDVPRCKEGREKARHSPLCRVHGAAFKQYDITMEVSKDIDRTDGCRVPALASI